MFCCFNQKSTYCHLPGEAVKDIIWKKYFFFFFTYISVPWNTVIFTVVFYLQLYILIVYPDYMSCLTFLESHKMQNWHQKRATSAGRGLCSFWNYCSIRRNLNVHRHLCLHFLTCWAGNFASLKHESLSTLFCIRYCKALKCGLLSLCFISRFCSLCFFLFFFPLLLLGKSDIYHIYVYLFISGL